jgi:hypothetical protein
LVLQNWLLVLMLLWQKRQPGCRQLEAALQLSQQLNCAIWVTLPAYRSTAYRSAAQQALHATICYHDAGHSIAFVIKCIDEKVMHTTCSASVSVSANLQPLMLHAAHITANAHARPAQVCRPNCDCW